MISTLSNQPESCWLLRDWLEKIQRKEKKYMEQKLTLPKMVCVKLACLGVLFYDFGIWPYVGKP